MRDWGRGGGAGRDGRRWPRASHLGPAHRAEDGSEARCWRQEEQEGGEEEGERERRGEERKGGEEEKGRWVGLKGRGRERLGRVLREEGKGRAASSRESIIVLGLEAKEELVLPGHGGCGRV